MGTSDIPSFLGYGAPDGSWTVDYPAQVKAWVRSLAGDTGCNLLITLADASQQKTRRQERGFHAMIAPWAHHRQERVDDLKQFLLAETFGTSIYVAPGGVELTVLAEPSTSRLTKAQYSQLIDRSIDIAAESDNYILIPPDEWRKAKEAERRKARKQP